MGFGEYRDALWQVRPAAAATTIDEKLADAGQVHALTGACPAVALHALWDLPHGAADVDRVLTAAADVGVRPGAINPNLFEQQQYAHGSFGNPDPLVRDQAIAHCIECVRLGQALGSRDVSLWFADGSNYPGTANIRARKRLFAEGLAAVHASLSPAQRLLVDTSRSSRPSTIRTSRTGGWRCCWRATPVPRPRCSSIPGITTCRRTSSRSSPGCSTNRCSAGFTSMTAAMRTMT